MLKGGEKVLKLKDVAEELNCSARTVYEWVKLGKINAVKTIGGWRISNEEVDRIKAGEKKEVNNG